MFVEAVGRDAAHLRVQEIEQSNREGMLLATLPYRVGIGLAVAAGIASIPLTYHLNSVLWFNEHFVTTDVAEPKSRPPPNDCACTYTETRNSLTILSTPHAKQFKRELF
jgi:hypothetical protein